MGGLWQQGDGGGGAASYAQYVWDPRYVDAPVCRFRDADGSPDDGLEEVLYYTQDANCNVTALVNTSGGVVERYTYDAYGKVTFRQIDWSLQTVAGSADGAASACDNQILYAGYRFDPESGLYHVRNRPYHPTLGAWPVRDPAGYVNGFSLYQYVRSSPPMFRDALGLCTPGKKREPYVEYKVEPLGITPNIDADEDKLVELEGDTERLAKIIGVVQTASAFTGEELSEGAAEALAQALDANMSTDMKDLAKEAKSIKHELLGAFGGYILYTRVAYEECESRCVALRLVSFNWEHSAWYPHHHDNWQPYAGGPNATSAGRDAETVLHGASYTSQAEAWMDAAGAGEERLDAWKEANKADLEE